MGREEREEEKNVPDGEGSAREDWRECCASWETRVLVRSVQRGEWLCRGAEMRAWPRSAEEQP